MICCLFSKLSTIAKYAKNIVKYTIIQLQLQLQLMTGL